MRTNRRIMKRKRNRTESNYRRAKINSWCKLLEKDFDWDYAFLLNIEYKKLAEMYNYFKSSTDTTPFVARDLRLCLRLLDIVLKKDDLQLEFSKVKFERMENKMYKVENLHIAKYRKLYINPRNATRFCEFKFPSNDHDIEIMHLNELRKAKAWYLYNKIRYYKMFEWWD